MKRNAHRRSYLTDLYEAALWLSRRSSEDTVFAAWNTGLLGYFSDRTFINLDGLVNTPDYHRRVLRSSRRLEAYRRYLREERVDYVVDVAETDDVRALTDDWPVVHTFSRDAQWGGWRMWKVRPDATPLREPGPGEGPG